MSRLRLTALGILVMLGLGASVAAYQVGLPQTAAPPARVTSGALVDIPVLMPGDDPEGLVILVTGRGDAKATGETVRQRLLAENMIVMPVDLEAWRAKLDAEHGECLYLGSDLEGLAKEALRTVDLDTYHHPVVAGIGEGGTLAYAALADAPVATLAGAVALDPAPALQTRLPTCQGAAPIVRSGRGFAYGTDTIVPGMASLIAPAAITPVPVAAAAPVVAPPEGNRPQIVAEPDAALRLDLAVQSVVAIAQADARTQALPIVDIPAQGPAQALVVFFSGDGGWRDLDKSVGDLLARNGVHVVGVDSLRYFWSERTPDEIAKDTAAIVAQADPDGKLPVAVMGYSFGADTFPFAWTRLSETLRDRIKMVGLLGTEKQTKFQVSVGGWLGLGGDQNVASAIATMPPERVVCVHGEDEDDTACNDKALSRIEVMTLGGGHHFDGDYESLADRLLAALKVRIGKAS